MKKEMRRYRCNREKWGVGVNKGDSLWRGGVIRNIE